MTVLEVQKRMRELGRIRLGEQVESSSGKKRPSRLERFRLTSPSSELLEAAADLYGGKVREWADAPTEGRQYELKITAERLEVIVPPQPIAEGQYLELFSAGGIKRRCDGRTELISGSDCKCDPGARECQITTHLLVILPEVPGLGVWRLVTHSWHAAAELVGQVELLERIAQAGTMPRAQLAIEGRTKRVEGQTRHYVVPVLEVQWSIAMAEREGVPMLGDAAVPLELPEPADDGPAEVAAIKPPLPEAIGAEPVASGDPESGEVAGVGEGEEGKAPDPAPATAIAEGRAIEAADGAPAIDAPWARYSTAVQDLGGGPSAVKAIALPICRREKWGYPPAPEWPAERLEVLTAALEKAAAPQLGEGS